MTPTCICRENIIQTQENCGRELWKQTQLNIKQWSCLLNSTRGAPKPEKCWWYLLDYTCTNGKWTYSEMVPRVLLITNPDGSKSPIKQEAATVSKKMLSIHDLPTGGNKGHLSYIKDKATQWVTRMTNGHLPSHTAWVASQHLARPTIWVRHNDKQYRTSQQAS
jgi:hypothetical protein